MRLPFGSIYRCPSGHPNFNYTKAIPDGAEVYVPPGSVNTRTATERALRNGNTVISEPLPSSTVSNATNSTVNEVQDSLDVLQTKRLREHWRKRAGSPDKVGEPRYRSSSIERLQQMGRGAPCQPLAF